MRVGDNRWFAVNVADYEIRSFPADSLKRDKLFYRVGNLPAEVVADFSRYCDNIPRLAVIKAAGMNNSLNIFNICRCIVVKRFVFGKKLGSDEIYPRVRALSGKPRRNKKLERITVFERTQRVGIYAF